MLVERVIIIVHLGACLSVFLQRHLIILNDAPSISTFLRQLHFLYFINGLCRLILRDRTVVMADN